VNTKYVGMAHFFSTFDHRKCYSNILLYINTD